MKTVTVTFEGKQCDRKWLIDCNNCAEGSKITHLDVDPDGTTHPEFCPFCGENLEGERQLLSEEYHVEYETEHEDLGEEDEDRDGA